MSNVTFNTSLFVLFGVLACTLNLNQTETSTTEFSSSSSSSNTFSNSSNSDSSSTGFQLDFGIADNTSFDSTSTSTSTGSINVDLGVNSSSEDSGNLESSGDSETSLCVNDKDGLCNAFVSSVVIAPNIGSEELSQFCTDLACDANICGKYRALIKITGNFWENNGFLGKYRFPSGKVFALGNNLPNCPIIEDEFGLEGYNNLPVFTGFAGLFFTCSFGNTPWISKSESNYVDIGYVNGSEKTWYTGKQISCNNLARVYCVEVFE